MKKLLSILLSVAIVISCLSMFSIMSVSGADELTGMNIEIAANNDGANKYLRQATLGLTTDDITTEADGSKWLVLSYRVYNLSDKNTWLNFTVQNGWGYLNPGAGGVCGSNQEVKANSYTDYTLKLVATADGKVGLNGAAALSALSMRFEVLSGNNVYTGQKFVVRAMSDAAAAFFKTTNTGQDIFAIKSLIYGDDAYATLVPTPTATATPTTTAEPTPGEGATPTAEPTPGEGATPTAEPTPAPTPMPFIAAEFKEVEATGNSYALCAWGTGKFLEDDNTFNGAVSNSYVIYNTGASDMEIVLSYNSNRGTMATIMGSRTDKIYIEAGGSAKLSVSIPVTNGVATLDSNGNTAKLSELRIRFDVQFVDDEEDNKFIVASATEDADDWFITSYTINKFEKRLLTKADLPVRKVPTGVTLKTEEEADGSGKLYFVTSTSGGLVSANDVKNNVIKKSFKIRNNSSVALDIKLELQALVNASWQAPSGLTSEYQTIKPGKTVTVVCEVTCSDGKVTIGESQVDISKLFGKFSIKGEDGTLPEGTSFTIFFSENEASQFATIARDGWTAEVIYTAVGAGTGDVLPIAMITTVAVALVALVVVSKKRKEN